ncbi:MAG: SPOR domain-containing protein [Pseudomonadota bacterium]
MKILKWSLAFLVLANIGLWMWATWYKDIPEEDDETLTALPSLSPHKMRLLSEPGVNLVPRKTLAGCYRIGPFVDSDQAAKAAAILNEQRFGFTQRDEEQKVVTYRVYLPPLSSKDAVEKQRQELTRIGFKDHAVILEEGWHNAISLGLFSIPANAEHRVRELTAKGVTAKVQSLTQTRLLHWLEITGPFLTETLSRLKEMNWDAKDVQLSEFVCPGANPAAPKETPPAAQSEKASH